MPLACHIGNKDLPHCSLPVRAIGFPRVLLQGIPWSVLGDVTIPHLIPAGTKCVPHVAPIGVGSPTVMVGGRAAGAITSKLIGCTAVAQGFSKVWCGF